MTLSSHGIIAIAPAPTGRKEKWRYVPCNSQLLRQQVRPKLRASSSHQGIAPPAETHSTHSTDFRGTARHHQPMNLASFSPENCLLCSHMTVNHAVQYDLLPDELAMPGLQPKAAVPSSSQSQSPHICQNQPATHNCQLSTGVHQSQMHNMQHEHPNICNVHHASTQAEPASLAHTTRTWRVMPLTRKGLGIHEHLSCSCTLRAAHA
jgi:hypothetical protein